MAILDRYSDRSIVSPPYRLAQSQDAAKHIARALAAQSSTPTIHYRPSRPTSTLTMASPYAPWPFVVFTPCPARDATTLNRSSMSLFTHLFTACTSPPSTGHPWPAHIEREKESSTLKDSVLTRRSGVLFTWVRPKRPPPRTHASVSARTCDTRQRRMERSCESCPGTWGVQGRAGHSTLLFLTVFEPVDRSLVSSVLFF